LPKPKKAVLGLVSTKLPEVETVDALKRRIDEATKFIDLERLCVVSIAAMWVCQRSRPRGFAMDLTERKLARVVEVGIELALARCAG
jgi:methionine synthase II (cobalamin-independent)